MGKWPEILIERRRDNHLGLIDNGDGNRHREGEGRNLHFGLWSMYAYGFLHSFDPYLHESPKDIIRESPILHCLVEWL